VLQCVAVCCSMLHLISPRVRKNGSAVLMECVAAYCSVLQYVAV